MPPTKKPRAKAAPIELLLRKLRDKFNPPLPKKFPRQYSHVTGRITSGIGEQWAADIASRLVDASNSGNMHFSPADLALLRAATVNHPYRSNMCNASYCVTCDAIVHGRSSCRGCNGCRAHCSAIRSCGECEYCGACCQHSGDRSVRGIVSTMHKQRGSRMAGLEVEYNRSKKFQSIKDWCKRWGSSVHSDGSCGWECVTSPAAGKKLTNQVADLAKSLGAAEATCNFKCGLHVHVDARDMTPGKIRNLCYLYGIVEPAMYAIGGEARAGVSYCKPNGEKLMKAAMNAKGWTVAIYKAIFTMDNSADQAVRDFVKHNTDKKFGTRYVGLNLCPWVAGLLGKKPDTTVEFRLHNGTLDGKELIGWAQLCVDLVEYAKTHKFDELRDSSLAAIGPVDALRTISPRSLEYIIDTIARFTAAGKHDRIRVSSRGLEFNNTPLAPSLHPIGLSNAAVRARNGCDCQSCLASDNELGA